MLFRSAADLPEVVPDDVLAMLCVGAEPGSVSRSATRDTPEVRVGATGVCLGVSSGSDELRLLVGRTAIVGSPLVVDTGDDEVTRELDISNVLNGGVETLRGAVCVDVDEVVRWVDGIVSSTRSSEVVCSGD